MPRDFRGLGTEKLKSRLKQARQGPEQDPEIQQKLRRRLAITQNRTAGIGSQGLEQLRAGGPEANQLRQTRDAALGIRQQTPGINRNQAGTAQETPGQASQGFPRKGSLGNIEGLRKRLGDQNRRKKRKPQYANEGRPVV